MKGMDYCTPDKADDGGQNIFSCVTSIEQLALSSQSIVRLLSQLNARTINRSTVDQELNQHTHKKIL